jgi:hypothetical protein
VIGGTGQSQADCILVQQGQDTTKTRKEFVDECECYFKAAEACFCDGRATSLLESGEARESALEGAGMQLVSYLNEPVVS